MGRSRQKQRTPSLQPYAAGLQWLRLPDSLNDFMNTALDYRKNSKNWDTLNYHRDCPTNGIVAFYRAILRSKNSDRITNRVDTDQTAP